MFASMAYMHLQESPDAYGIASGELECVMPRTVPDRCVMALVLVLSGLCVCVCTVRRGLLTAKWRAGMLPSIRYVNMCRFFSAKSLSVRRFIFFALNSVSALFLSFFCSLCAR